MYYLKCRWEVIMIFFLMSFYFSGCMNKDLINMGAHLIGIADIYVEGKNVRATIDGKTKFGKYSLEPVQ